MAEAWHIARSSRTCAGSGESIEPGAPFYSALLEGDDTFERRDYSLAAWPEADKSGFFSYWKNKGGEPREKDDKKLQVDYDRLLSFFDSLEGSEDPGRILFRYVLALILVRRRRLRLDDMQRTDTGDRLVIYDRRHERTLEIVAPEATRDDMQKVQAKLNELFECDFNTDF